MSFTLCAFRDTHYQAQLCIVRHCCVPERIFAHTTTITNRISVVQRRLDEPFSHRIAKVCTHFSFEFFCVLTLELPNWKTPIALWDFILEGILLRSQKRLLVGIFKIAKKNRRCYQAMSILSAIIAKQILYYRNPNKITSSLNVFGYPNLLNCFRSYLTVCQAVPGTRL